MMNRDNGNNMNVRHSNMRNLGNRKIVHKSQHNVNNNRNVHDANGIRFNSSIIKYNNYPVRRPVGKDVLGRLNNKILEKHTSTGSRNARSTNLHARTTGLPSPSELGFWPQHVRRHK